MQKCTSIIVLFCLSNLIFSQLPETDLWLFKIKSDKGNFILAEGKNITNRKGYDNQPVFTADNKSIIYVSIREDNQADVYRYEIKKKESIQVTKTKESEYSPNFTPNNKFISCVVVEKDSSQRLWLYNLDGTVKKCYNEGIDSIGYYSWLSDDTLLYYKLTEPHSLRMYTEAGMADKWVCNNPTRAFKKQTSNNFIYGIKDSTQIQYRVFNPILRRSDEFANHHSTNEDFVWNNSLGLIKSEGTKLYLFNEKSKAWTVMFDFSTVGISKITRFVFDSKMKNIVIVDNK